MVFILVLNDNYYFIYFGYTFYRYGNHIFIITTPSINFSSIPAKEKSDEIELIRNREAYVSGLQVKLKDIPTYIKIKRQLYKIRGTINLIIPTSLSVDSIGHYEAYCFRECKRQWELFDDLKNAPKNCKENTVINAEMIIYTI